MEELRPNTAKKSHFYPFRSVTGHRPGLEVEEGVGASHSAKSDRI